MPAFFASLIAGLFFGTWPLIMKKCGLHPMMAAIIVNGGAMLALAPFLRRENFVGATRAAILIAAVAAILNGIGHIFFQTAITAKDFGITHVILVMVLAEICANMIGGSLLYHDPFTLKKGLGVATAVIAIILLRS